MNIAEKLLAVDANTDRVEALNSELENILGGHSLPEGSVGGSSIPLQEKTINIVENGTSEVIPDVGYALSKATVNVNVPIPSGYIKPSGQKEVSENGTYDVAEFEKVNVNVSASEGDTLTEFLRVKGMKYLFYGGSTGEYSLAESDMTALVTMIPSGAIVDDISYMFSSQLKITTVPLFDTSNVTVMRNLFSGCKSLVSVPLFDTSKVTTMLYMLSACEKLTTVPLFDTRNVTVMNYMFNGCKSLVSVPLFDTSKVTTMHSMFKYCSSLESPPLFNTINVTDMYEMFSQCAKIITVPLFDTRNVTTMAYMFAGCTILAEVPLFDTRKVTAMNYMFESCKSLTVIPAFDCRMVTTFSGMVNACTSLMEIWIKNIKFPLTVGSGTSYGHLLTVDSLVHLCYELRDTVSSRTLTMGATNLEKLANVYVKTIPITDEMRAEDDLIDEKLPFVRCESTDEGATLISDYVSFKNWALK